MKVVTEFLEIQDDTERQFNAPILIFQNRGETEVRLSGSQGGSAYVLERVRDDVEVQYDELRLELDVEHIDTTVYKIEFVGTGTKTLTVIKRVAVQS